MILEEVSILYLSMNRQKNGAESLSGVANDKVFNTVELFFEGLIDKNEAINRLRYEKPNLQICLRTEKALESLRFEGSEVL